MATIVKDALGPLANRKQLAFVFGSMASGKQPAHSDLDICILGGLELFEVVKALDSIQETLQREINPVVMRSNRFIDQLANHNRFAERIFDESKVYVIGDDDEFAELAQHQ